MELSANGGSPVNMDFSLGEVQSLCQKAARGAGRAHGVAEDAGRAARWLCARGEDGAGALARLLQASDGAAAADLVPDLADMTPKGTAICPLMLGGYLSDSATLPDAPIGPVWEPSLLLPFVADLSPKAVAIVDAGGGRIRFVPAPHVEASRTRTRLDPETLDILTAFAARTYAPATEASRTKGAGAGLGDND